MGGGMYDHEEPLQQQQQQQQPELDLNQEPMMMMQDEPYNNTSDYIQQQQEPDFHQDQYQQEEDNYYFDSEYGKPNHGNDSTPLPLLSTSSSFRNVVRQDSASSLLDHSLDISLKKIEVMEDEYGKMKMALLSDLDEPDQEPEYLLPSPAYVPDYVPELPHDPEFVRPPHPPRQRSRDNLESIFGGGPGYNDSENEGRILSPPLSPPLIEAATESRYNTYLSSSFHDDNFCSVVQDDFHSKNAAENAFENAHRSGARNPLSLIEEPFPICISPELELSMSGLSVTRTSGHIDTIPEMPDEEDGSPTTADGVSRKRGGKLPKMVLKDILFFCFSTLALAHTSFFSHIHSLTQSIVYMD